MFDISWGELVLIGMVALIVIGPKELPTVLRTVGQWMTKMRRMAADFQGQFQEAMREAEFADLKKQVDSISDPTQYNPLEVAQKEIDNAFAEPSTVTPSGETAASATTESGSAEPTAPSVPASDVTPSGEPASPASVAPAPPDATAASTEPAPAPKSDLEGGRAA